MKTSLVIFDLDGTLLDTIGDLAVACNAVLGVRGLPQHTYEEYCHFVGNGILRRVRRCCMSAIRGWTSRPRRLPGCARRV